MKITQLTESSKTRSKEDNKELYGLDMFPGLPADRLQWALNMTERGYTWDPNSGTMVKTPPVPQN